MKRYIFLLFYFLIAATVSEAQQNFTNHSLSFDYDSIQISSICNADTLLYMPGEDDKKIYITDTGGKWIKSLPLIGLQENDEIEACTLYKGKLYILSEKGPHLYAVDIATGRASSINIPQASTIVDNGSNGVEGMATNGIGKLYLLYERKEIARAHCVAELYTYTIDTTNPDDVILKKEREFSIALDSCKQRYADLYFDSVNQRLLLLRSAIGTYTIQSLAANTQGFIDEASPVDVATYSNLTTVANQIAGKRFNNNMEGITMDHAGHLYIVSDNYYKGHYDSAHNKTLLLKSD